VYVEHLLYSSRCVIVFAAAGSCNEVAMQLQAVLNSKLSGTAKSLCSACCRSQSFATQHACIFVCTCAAVDDGKATAAGLLRLTCWSTDSADDQGPRV
jgi:hypothetical protein